MKQILSTIMLLLAGVFTTYAQSSATQTNNMKENKKVLVAFFSHTGENYGVGHITKGNTHIIAEMIAEETGGELFQIETVKPYPDGYKACVEIAKKEKESNARPEITGDIAVEDYDVIFLGYPNWWGEMPMPVYTFIDKHNWQGKTVIPFCTHEGSGLSATPQSIRNTCKGSTVSEGLAVRGTTAQKQREQAQKAVRLWLEKLKTTKKQ